MFFKWFEIMNEELLFCNANEGDTDEVLRLYESVKGTGYCRWNQDYPSLETIKFDLSRDALYVLKNEQGEIIGAISVDNDENVNRLTCFSDVGTSFAEVSRLVISKSYQNRGLACYLVRKVMEVLKEKGYVQMRYMVSKNNPVALQSYKKLDFKRVGEAVMYDDEYWCYEKML